MGKTKFFDRELYKKNDRLAKKCVEQLLDKRKYTISENPKKRGVDLLVYNKGNHVFNIECEIKRVWDGKNFKYDTVQIPERKEKYAKLNKPTYFVMFNSDQSNYLVIRGKDLLNSPKLEVPNKYMYSGEYFFQVPLKKVFFDNIKEAISK